MTRTSDIPSALSGGPFARGQKAFPGRGAVKPGRLKGRRLKSGDVVGLYLSLVRESGS